jgi:cytochrome b
MRRSGSVMTEEGEPTSGSAPGAVSGRVVRVWDAPTRWVHGLIILLIGLAWWTERHDQMDWHIRIGCALAGVVLFRGVWGVIGSATARFSSFVRGPSAVLVYAANLFRRGAADGVVGHNPMGGWSVVALLGVIAAEVGVGFFCVDVDGLESGPLSNLVSFQAGRAAAHWHTVLFNVLLGLIALHLCAIAFYAVVRRENLIWPMVTGRKRLPTPPPELNPSASYIQAGSSIRFWAAALISAACAVWAATGFKI